MVSEPDTEENIQATYNHYRGRSFEPLDFDIEGHMFDVADVFHELCIFYAPPFQISQEFKMLKCCLQSHIPWQILMETLRCYLRKVVIL